MASLIKSKSKSLAMNKGHQISRKASRWGSGRWRSPILAKFKRIFFSLFLVEKLSLIQKVEKLILNLQVQKMKKIEFMEILP